MKFDELFDPWVLSISTLKEVPGNRNILTHTWINNAVNLTMHSGSLALSVHNQQTIEQRPSYGTNRNNVGNIRYAHPRHVT